MNQKVLLQELIQDRQPLTIDLNATAADAARLMTGQCRGGAVLVTRHGELAGIFTERDLMQKVVAVGLNPQRVHLHQVMTRELVTAQPQETHQMALRKMVTANCRHLPVLDEHRLVGMVSRRQLLEIDVELLEGELERYDPSLLYAFP